MKFVTVWSLAALAGFVRAQETCTALATAVPACAVSPL
jgi:hypothetical protein